MKLGLARLQEYLTLFEYGNQDLSVGIIFPGPENPAWASSSLKISPKEQIVFLQNMLQGALVSEHALQMTKAILFREELSEGWKLYGRTGTGINIDDHGLKVRWFVGWIEKSDQTFPFVYQIRAKTIDNSLPILRVKQLMKESRCFSI